MARTEWPRLLHNLRHEEKAIRLGGSVAQRFLVREGRADLVGPGHVHERNGVGGGFHLADIDLTKLLDIAENLTELRAELLFLVGREAQPREMRDVLHIKISCSHAAESRNRCQKFKE